MNDNFLLFKKTVFQENNCFVGVERGQEDRYQEIGSKGQQQQQQQQQMQIQQQQQQLPCMLYMVKMYKPAKLFI